MNNVNYSDKYQKEMLLKQVDIFDRHEFTNFYNGVIVK